MAWDFCYSLSNGFTEKDWLKYDVIATASLANYSTLLEMVLHYSTHSNVCRFAYSRNFKNQKYTFYDPIFKSMSKNKFPVKRTIGQVL